MNPREINPQKYNTELAEALKEIKEFKVPEWSLYVKSSAHKERPSTDPDFWYKRSASVLKQFYTKGSVGVSRLRSRFGGKKDRGMRPSEFRKSGGKIIRVILQQAESAGLLEKSDGEKSVRKLSEKGKKFLEDVADKASKSSKEKTKIEEVKK
jgi:small subunit ribosomal protein S19e